MKIRKLLVVVGIAALVFAACSDDGDDEGPSGVDDSYTGVVTSLESEGLNKVTSFELKTQDDETVEILIDEGVSYGFPLGHLEEHRITAAPVEVVVDVRDGDLFAQSIEDVEGG